MDLDNANHTKAKRKDFLIFYSICIRYIRVFQYFAQFDSLLRRRHTLSAMTFVILLTLPYPCYESMSAAVHVILKTFETSCSMAQTNKLIDTNINWRNQLFIQTKYVVIFVNTSLMIRIIRNSEFNASSEKWRDFILLYNSF